MIVFAVVSLVVAVIYTKGPSLQSPLLPPNDTNADLLEPQAPALLDPTHRLHM